MRFVPYEKITYKTKLGYNQIIKRIQDTIEPKKFIRLIKGNQKKAYEGKVQGNNFTINRIITFTNVFSPVIYGTITKEKDETRIDIKLKLQPVVIAVMIAWLGVVGYIFVSSLINYMMNDVLNKNFSTSLLVLAVGYIMMTGAFKSESGKEKSKLEELFEAVAEK